MHHKCEYVGLFCALIVAVLTFGRSNAEALTLAKEGNATAVIVLPDKPVPAVNEAANILADHLEQISGASFQILREGELEAKVEQQRIVTNLTAPIESYVLLGEGRLTELLEVSSAELGPGGILIRTYPNALVLLGPGKSATDTYGTFYAVTTFLEDSLGCRFLWPGELGKVVPKRATIKIGSLNHTFTPKLKQRRIRMAGGYGERKAAGVKRLGFQDADYLSFNREAMETESRDGGWDRWHRLGGSLRLASGHSLGYMWEKHKDEHPEWFAVQPNGKRDQSRSPDRARLCVSNSELIEEIARDRIERLHRSDLKSVSIGPNDGGQTSFCGCEQCRRLDPPNSRKLPGGGVALTDRYVYFWNEIASRVVKEHPDAILTADAYSVYSAPPVERKLHPNIAIRFVGLTYLDEQERKADREDWIAWSKAANRIFFRPNVLLAGRRQGVPLIYVHKMSEDFRYLVDHSLVGTDFDSCCHNWATQGLNYYVCAKLHWNPDLDIDELIDNYCNSGFESGAMPVKQYFLRIEELTNQIAAQQLNVTEPYNPEVIAELRGYLDEAAAATKDEPLARRRVAFLRSGLDYTDAYVAAFRIIRAHQASGRSRLPPETKQQISDALDNNWRVSRTIFENDHLAVNVATVAWGSWNYFVRFGWSGPSEAARDGLQTQ